MTGLADTKNTNISIIKLTKNIIRKYNNLIEKIMEHRNMLKNQIEVKEIQELTVKAVFDQSIKKIHKLKDNHLEHLFFTEEEAAQAVKTGAIKGKEETPENKDIITNEESKSLIARNRFDSENFAAQVAAVAKLNGIKQTLDFMEIEGQYQKAIATPGLGENVKEEQEEAYKKVMKSFEAAKAQKVELLKKSLKEKFNKEVENKKQSQVELEKNAELIRIASKTDGFEEITTEKLSTDIAIPVFAIDDTLNCEPLNQGLVIADEEIKKKKEKVEQAAKTLIEAFKEKLENDYRKPIQSLVEEASAKKEGSQDQEKLDATGQLVILEKVKKLVEEYQRKLSAPFHTIPGANSDDLENDVFADQVAELADKVANKFKAELKALSQGVKSALDPIQKMAEAEQMQLLNEGQRSILLDAFNDEIKKLFTKYTTKAKEYHDCFITASDYNPDDKFGIDEVQTSVIATFNKDFKLFISTRTNEIKNALGNTPPSTSQQIQEARQIYDKLSQEYTDKFDEIDKAHETGAVGRKKEFKEFMDAQELLLSQGAEAREQLDTRVKKDIESILARLALATTNHLAHTINFGVETTELMLIDAENPTYANLEIDRLSKIIGWLKEYREVLRQENDDAIKNIESQKDVLGDMVAQMVVQAREQFEAVLSLADNKMKSLEDAVKKCLSDIREKVKEIDGAEKKKIK